MALLVAVLDAWSASADWILKAVMPGAYRLVVEAVRSLPWLEWGTFLRAADA